MTSKQTKTPAPTPSPWATDGYESIIKEEPIGVWKTIVKCVHKNDNSPIDEPLANARHIVHCVNNFEDLVEACKSLVEYADNLADNVDEPTEEEMELFEKVYNKCTKALKNATEDK